MSKQDGPANPPSPASSKRALQRVVLSEALQHPTTLLPGAAAILSGAYMGLISFDRTAFAIGLASSLVAAGSWVYHYFIKGEQVAKAHLAKQNEARQRQKKMEMLELARSCAELNFQDGKRAALQLDKAYDQFQQFLAEAETTGNSSAKRFDLLAQSCLREGKILIGQAMSLHKVLQATNQAKLQKELERRREQAALMRSRLKRGESVETRLKAIQTHIESHQRRLDLYQARQDTLAEILAQCDVLQAAMETAHLEMVDLLRTKTSVITGEDPAQRLEQAVRTARIVEERLQGMVTNNDPEEDAMYRDAGRQLN